MDPVVKACPKCNKPNDPRLEKCKYCGGSLADVEPVKLSSLQQNPPTPPAEEHMSSGEDKMSEPEPRVPKAAASAQGTSMKKICPNCNSVNPANITTCDCGLDLSNVTAIPGDKVDFELERLKGVGTPPPEERQEQDVSAALGHEDPVRLCENPDCNHISPVNVRFCERCGAPLLRVVSRSAAEAEVKRRGQSAKQMNNSPKSGHDAEAVFPMPQESSAPAASARLVAIDGSFAYSVNNGTVTIGRKCEMKEFLKDKNYVSRSHAELTFSGGYLNVTDTGSTNGTYVNKVRLKPNIPQRLKKDDILGLGAGSDRDPEDKANAAFFKVELR